ncbi:MAG: leucine--tRNA ligase, partial [Acidobacteria bacterium]
PPEKDLDWSDAGIEGSSRFLNRVYRLVAKHSEKLRPVVTRRSDGTPGSEFQELARWATLRPFGPEERRLLRKAHQSLRHVTEDMEERWHFNTDIAMTMELVNELTDLEPAFEAGKIRPEIFKSALEYLVLMNSLFAPHIADELWEGLGNSKFTLRVPWPAFNQELAAEDELELPVQVNGKLRGRIRVAVNADEEEIRRRALAEEKVAQHLNGRQVVKIIIVPQKLVNIVVR